MIFLAENRYNNYSLFVENVQTNFSLPAVFFLYKLETRKVQTEERTNNKQAITERRIRTAEQELNSGARNKKLTASLQRCWSVCAQEHVWNIQQNKKAV